MQQTKKIILYVVNVDWFFVSHRLPLAQEAKRRSFDVYLLTKDTGYFDELRKLGICCINIDFNRSFSNPFKEFKCLFLLFKYYYKLKPLVVHHITIKQIIYGTIAAAFSTRRSRIINAVTGLGYAFADYNRKTNRNLLKLMMRLSFSLVRSKFVFQNPDDKRIFQDMGFITNNNSIIIKGAGVDETVFCRDDYENDVDKKISIVLVGRMLKDKGIIEFVKAAEILRPTFYSTAEFILVGGIDATNPAALLESDIKELVDNDYIRWLGKRSDIKFIYANTDIACLPSYREGLPKSLVEAMAMECPIITTNAVGCRECVEDGVNGFIVPIGDVDRLAERISTLILDKSLRITFGRASRIKMLNEMSLTHIVKKTFEYYEL